jgi:hypothetical protein
MENQDSPLEPVIDGRGPDGRFLPGNRAAKGNPYAAKVARLRSALINAVSQKELRLVVRKLIDQAKLGDVPAARLLLGYAVGVPDQRHTLSLDPPLPETAVLVEDDNWYGNAGRLAEASAAKAAATTEARPDTAYNSGPGGNGDGNGHA